MDAAAVATRNTGLLHALLQQWREQSTRQSRPSARAHALAALAAECQAVANTSPGQGANNQLNVSGFNLGQLVAAGSLTFEECQSALRGAALQAGCDNPKKDHATIDRGLRAGMKSPRDGRAGSPPPATNGQTIGHAQPSANGMGHGAAQAKATEPEPWGKPIPLNAAPKAEPFPLEVLPVRLARFVQECAWACNCPLDFVALPLLSVAGGIVGNSRRLSITRSHRQSACLWAVIVGPPGSGKSAPLDLLKEPLEQIDREQFADFKQKLADWNTSPLENRGPKPTPVRLLIENSTIESVVKTLSENPRGLIELKDELSALVTGMDQYKDGGKGSERQTRLSIWSGATIRNDRKSNVDSAPVIVRQPFIATLGGIQPGVIDFLKGAKRGDAPPPDDGFLDRFLVAYPEPLPAIGEQWREVSKQAADDWEAVCAGLLEMQMDTKENGDRVARLVRLTADGKQAWVDFTESHAAEINDPDFAEHLRGPWSKLTGYCARLALVLNCLRYVCSETESEDVDGESMRRAWKLVAYFKSSFRKLVCAMGSDPRVQEARKIVAWMERNRSRKEFTRRDVYRDLGSSFKRPEAVDQPLRLLADHGFIRPVQEGDNRTTGRKATQKYEVNPLWPQN